MENELNETQKTEIATQTTAPRGFEAGLDKDDLLTPRAKLIQAMSPEMVSGVDGIKVGLIINSLSKEPLPQEFIPIFAFKNFVRFNPRKKEQNGFDPAFEPGAIIWRTNDPTDPRVLQETKFGANGEVPIATTFLNFFSYFPGCPMPIVISFSKTSYKTGKKLISLARYCGTDMFGKKYKLYSEMETKNTDTYAVLKISPTSNASDSEYQTCEKLWQDFSPKVKDIEVHQEEESNQVA